MRRKAIPIITAAVVGGFIFGLATFLVSSTHSNDYIYVRFLFGWPGSALSVAMGISSAYFSSDASAIALFVIVNGVIGALLGVLVAYMWRLIVNNNHEK